MAEAGFTEIVLVAFVGQLAVLPGEKVQFIIAGLSTRYHPLLVVGAAGSAFGIWTAVEIVVGEALQRALPGWVLTLLSGVIFLAFAVWLFASAPEEETTMAEATGSEEGGPAHDDAGESAPGTAAQTDGGLAAATQAVDLDATVLGREVPGYLGGFLPIFAMMMVGEFGDKTQIVTINWAAQYGATPAIWIGEMLAIIPVSLANAYFFHTFSHRFDLRAAHLVSAGIFAFFGLDTFLGFATGFSVWETLVASLAGLV